MPTLQNLADAANIAAVLAGRHWLAAAGGGDDESADEGGDDTGDDTGDEAEPAAPPAPAAAPEPAAPDHAAPRGRSADSHGQG